ncbi:hypothetical protein ACHAPT_012767 [Fusarium lateritium]
MANSAAQAFMTEEWTLLALSICIMIFRTYARAKQVGFRHFEPDDYLMPLVIIPFSIETTMAYLVVGQFHGLSNSNMSPAERSALDPDSTEYKLRVGGSKSQVVGWFTYTTVLWVIKSALCSYYLRLTVSI